MPIELSPSAKRVKAYLLSRLQEILKPSTEDGEAVIQNISDRLVEADYLLTWLVDSLIPKTEWPCGECGREHAKAPLCLNKVELETGRVHYVGCFRCNHLELFGQIKEHVQRWRV